MTRPDNCPHCGVSLIGGKIPDHINQPYVSAYDGKTHRPYGDATHWRREIGVEIRGVYDGVLYYECPDCHGAWNRWPDEPKFKSLYDKAAKAIKEHYSHENHRVHHVSVTTPSVKHRTDDWDKVTCSSCKAARPR